jgi:tRNA pseudouridine(38-40) synthase
MILVKGKGIDKSPLNLFYQDRAWVLRDANIDLQRLEEACSFFVGRHCLKNFVRINTREPDPLGYVRSIDSIRLCRNPYPFLNFPAQSNEEDDIISLAVEIKAKSFLWNQIRILVQTLVNYS